MLTFGIDDPHHAMKQAHQTASVYARAALEFLERNDLAEFTPEAKATFIVGFMQAAATDFHGAAVLSAGQHIANALNRIAESAETKNV